MTDAQIREQFDVVFDGCVTPPPLEDKSSRTGWKAPRMDLGGQRWRRGAMLSSVLPRLLTLLQQPQTLDELQRALPGVERSYLVTLLNRLRARGVVAPREGKASGRTIHAVYRLA